MRPANNLPVELTSFVGRRAEIERLSALVSTNRLVSLTGPGGVGKTRLAMQVAQSVSKRFVDGVWFVDLTATTDQDVVPSLLADALSVGDIETVSARELTDVVTSYLADKELQLVLDNCEHVADSVRNLLTSILTRCPGVHVLATSRATIDLEGEVVYRVSPLSVEDPSGRRPEAVQLFLDRAAQIRADRDPTPESLEDIGLLVQRLEGLPLAIELAASRTKLLSPRQILDRLVDRLQFLEGGTERPDRHETLAATIGWSYELLEPAEQRALQWLAVFNGWSLEAAEATLTTSDTLGLLGGLVDKSLIDVVPRSPANRYRMLDAVRRYALDRLAEAGEEELARLAHAEHLLDLAQRSSRALKGPEQADWIERIKFDHDNMRSALEWALSTGRAKMALRFVAALGRFWFMQTHWKEALRWFDRVTEAAGVDEEVDWARAFIETGAIKMITRGGLTDTGQAERARRILAEHGSTSELGRATYCVADTLTGVGDAPDLMAEALRLCEEADDAWGAAFAHRWLGSKVELVGDAEQSVAHQQTGVIEFRRLGDRWSAGWLSFDLGFSLLAMGRYEESKKAFEEAMDLASGLDDRLIVAHAARGLASVSAGLGRTEEAEAKFKEAMPMLEQIGDEACLAFSQLYLSEVTSELGRTDEATSMLVEAAEGFTRLGHRPGVASALRRLGRVAAARGEAETAAKLLGAAHAHTNDIDQLSPPEQALLDDLEAQLDPDDPSLRSALAAGETTPISELIAELAAGRPHHAPIAEASADDVVETTPEPPWPGEHTDLVRHLHRLWEVEGEVLAHRGLGGKSGALVTAVDLTCRGFSGQAILKLEEVDTTKAGETEADLHLLAFERSPEFAAEHLPRVVHSASVGTSAAVLSTIAGRGLEYVLPWTECSYPTQLEAGKRMARAILEDWNTDYRLVDSMLQPDEVLSGWLDYRLDPARGGRLHRFLEGTGSPPEAPTLIWQGHWYPNPLAFALGVAPSPEALALRPIIGNIHGDLHGYNLLIRERQNDLDWFLIDLAFYTPDGFLFFDHAYFELSHLLEARHRDPLDRWMQLLAALAGRRRPQEDDVGLIDLLDALRTEAFGWVEGAEPDRMSYMESQMMLARVAVGLNFTHKGVPAQLKRRGFLYAMSSLKEYVRFHGLDWPKTGVQLTFR